MPTLKTLRRSVSPFGLKAAEAGPFDELDHEFEKVLGKPAEDGKPSLDSISDGWFVPFFVKKIAAAAAHDAPDLEKLSQYLLVHKAAFEAKGLDHILYRSMEKLFDLKTEIFLIGDDVLFAQERDLLVGRYFAPITENNPGLFSEFVARWIETENLDRLLHFLDFSAGSKKPTFEHYLVFTHPALQRIVSNKNQLRALLKKTAPLLQKIASQTWEVSLRTVLEI